MFGDGDGEPDYAEATGTLLHHAAHTVRRAGLGLALGGGLGVAAGLAVFCLRTQCRAALALLSAGKSVPLFSLVPLFIYWFSGRELGIVCYVAVAVFLVVAVASLEAAANVPPRDPSRRPDPATEP